MRLAVVVVVIGSLLLTAVGQTMSADAEPRCDAPGEPMARRVAERVKGSARIDVARIAVRGPCS